MAAKKGGKGKREGGGTIVIKREEGGGHAHHGGAWKVAYADFVTAMMAFFLLMWLLNATTEEQRRGLADHFSPMNTLGRSVSGSGQPFGGKTPNSDGTAVSDAGSVRVEKGPSPARLDIDEEEGEAPPPPGPPATDLAEADTPPEWRALAEKPLPEPNPADAVIAQATDAALRAELARREGDAFERAAEELRAAVRDDPALAELARQLVIEQVPEGLRIQILDAERQPMFASGSAQPNERARGLLARVAAVAARLPNGLSVAGHTDAAAYRGDARSNWELSAERANSVRRLLLDGGIGAARIHSVAGHADRTPLLPAEPLAAANRRVAITLLRAAPGPQPPGPQPPGPQPPGPQLPGTQAMGTAPAQAGVALAATRPGAGRTSREMTGP